MITTPEVYEKFQAFIKSLEKDGEIAVDAVLVLAIVGSDTFGEMTNYHLSALGSPSPHRLSGLLEIGKEFLKR